MQDSTGDVQFHVLTPQSCDGCGLCCLGTGSPVLWYASHYETLIGHPFRPAGLPQQLIDEIDTAFGGLMRGQEPQEQCLWFNAATKSCRHYEWRPQVCQDYELGGTACLTTRRPDTRDETASLPSGV